jgi:hypothetical protein
MAAVLFSMWLAVALAARADAASLHKCKHAGGGISYQSAPCGPGEQQVWARELMPDGESVPKPSRVAAARVPAAASRPVRPAANAPRASPPRRSASRACKSAKAADAAYRAQPLSRVTHDGLRRHGDRIRLACGPG